MSSLALVLEDIHIHSRIVESEGVVTAALSTMARKNRQIMTSVCQAFPGERKQDIRNMRSSCRTSLLGVLSIYLLLAPGSRHPLPYPDP